MKTLPVLWENDAEYTRVKVFAVRGKIGVEELHREAVRLVIRRPELLKEIRNQGERESQPRD